MSRFRALWQASVNATRRALTWNLEDLVPPSERYVFKFDSKEELKRWHLYSDSEYGGLSSASLEIKEFADRSSGTGLFSGNLSLDVEEGSKWNISRSGFCGMRSKKFDGFIDLDAYDTLALKLKGDGRCYISTIYTENWVNSPGQQEDNSWQAFVFVPKDNWYIAKIPLARYLPTWRGNVIDAKLEMNPARIVGMSLSVNAEGGVPGAKSGPDKLHSVAPDQEFIDRLKFLNTLDPDDRKGTSLVTENNLFGAGLRLTDPSTETGRFIPVFYPLDPPPTDQMTSAKARAEARLAKIIGKKTSSAGGTAVASASGTVAKRKTPPEEEPPSKRTLVEPSSIDVVVVDFPPTQTLASEAPAVTDRPSTSSAQHPLGTNRFREEACAIYGDGRPNFWLDFVKAATPNADMVATFPGSVRDASEVPLRAFTPELAMAYNCMEVDEQIRFSSALLGQALNVVVHSAEGVADLKKESAELQKNYAEMQRSHIDLLGRHESLQEAHLTCPAVQESLKGEIARAKDEAERTKKALAEAELENKKMADQLAAIQEQLARLEGEKKAAQEQVAKAREEGLEAGRSEGQEVYRRSAECETLFNLTYVDCYEELIGKVEAGATAEDLRAALRIFKKDNDLEDEEPQGTSAQPDQPAA